MKIATTLLLMLIPIIAWTQHSIIIDGHFDDWQQVTTIVTDPPNDEHDTDWYGDGKAEPEPRKYADVDLLEARFTHDRENLYGYVKARGHVGRTSASAGCMKR